jgi:glycosyltransferase involved in cell wall biosynthesis
MKIGMFSETYIPTPDGVAYQIWNLKSELERKGNEVYVFTCGRKWYEVEEHTHRFFSVVLPQYKQYRFALFPYLKVRAIVKKIDLDVIHIHTPFSMGIAGFLAKEARPLVGSFHTNLKEQQMNFTGILASKTLMKPVWTLTLGLYRRCDVITTPSERIKKFLEQEGIGKEVQVVWNGIDANKLRSYANSIDIRDFYKLKHKHIIAYVGRVSADKGLETLIQAMKTVKEHNAVLIIGGVGPKENDLKMISKSLKLEDNVKFLGYVKEEHKPAILAQSDIFVLPSKGDVQPIAVMEAMCCGSAVVGSNAGGIPDLLKHNENGLLFNYGNVKELTDSLITLIQNESLRRRLRDNSVRFALSSCTIEQSALQFIKIYKQLLEQKELNSSTRIHSLNGY